MFNVYGLIQTKDKLVVWNEVGAKIKEINSKMVISGGDLNVIIDLDEKGRVLDKVNKVMLDFQNFIDLAEVVDYVPIKGKYKSTNRREGFTSISKRLCRLLLGHD